MPHGQLLFKINMIQDLINFKPLKLFFPEKYHFCHMIYLKLTGVFGSNRMPSTARVQQPIEERKA